MALDDRMTSWMFAKLDNFVFFSLFFSANIPNRVVYSINTRNKDERKKYITEQLKGSGKNN